ncbi:hypothetical protein, partial [Klebsiella pneumoniae]|uniref:hypothetical protein n=1 Tax=Klebsiella pneumoniae TaxID=573 RepID=UPI003B5B5CE8
EAARRGLDCETSCPLIFDNYLKPASIAMFESTGVMTRKELEARNEVKWETYTKGSFAIENWPTLPVWSGSFA